MVVENLIEILGVAKDWQSSCNEDDTNCEIVIATETQEWRTSISAFLDFTENKAYHKEMLIGYNTGKEICMIELSKVVAIKIIEAE
jgi:hypothetical protein